MLNSFATAEEAQRSHQRITIMANPYQCLGLKTPARGQTEMTGKLPTSGVKGEWEHPSSRSRILSQAVALPFHQGMFTKLPWKQTIDQSGRQWAFHLELLPNCRYS